MGDYDQLKTDVINYLSLQAEGKQLLINSIQRQNSGLETEASIAQDYKRLMEIASALKNLRSQIGNLGGAFINGHLDAIDYNGWVNPLEKIIIRGEDRYGGGWFKAPRTSNPDGHSGVDCLADVGTPIYAAHDGTIRLNDTEIAGLTVNIDFSDSSGNYWTASNSHLLAFAVDNGQFVHAGDLIGFVGQTGNAFNTRSHLHFGVYKNGKAIDPSIVLPDLNSDIAKKTKQDYSPY